MEYWKSRACDMLNMMEKAQAQSLRKALQNLEHRSISVQTNLPFFQLSSILSSLWDERDPNPLILLEKREQFRAGLPCDQISISF